MRALPYPLVQGLVRGVPRAARGGASNGVLISQEDPRLFSLGGAQVLDVWLRDADIYIQFGDSNIATNFDPALAKYYVRTFDPGDPINFPGFGVKPIGVPPGATHFAALSIQPGARIRTRRIALDQFPGYGLDEFANDQALRCTVTGSILTAPLNATVNTLPVQIIALCRVHTLGASHAFVALETATNTAGGAPCLGLQHRFTTVDHWNALYKRTAAAFTVSPSVVGGNVMSVTADEWALVAATFTDNGSGQVRCAVFRVDAVNLQDETVSSSGEEAFTGPPNFTRVAIGGYTASSGASSLLDALSEVKCHFIHIGTPLTAIQLQQWFPTPFAPNDGEAELPPWNILYEDAGGDMADVRSWGMLIDGVYRELTTGKIYAEDASFTAGTFAPTAYTVATIRRHNCWVTQDANGVLKIPYIDTAESGLTATPPMSSCQWDSQSHDDVTYDNVAPQTAVVTKAAGEETLFCAGGAIDLNVDTPTAGKTGTLDNVGEGFKMDLYTPAQSGIAYTITSGTITLDGTARSYALFVPNSGWNGCAVIGSVGTGAQLGGGTYVFGQATSEYGDLMALFASCGYAFLMLAHADEGIGDAAKDYPERYREFLELVQDVAGSSPATVKINAALGSDPTSYIWYGHSSGGITILMNSHGTWTDVAGGNIAHNDPVPTMPGSAPLLGAIVMSGTSPFINQNGATVPANAWETVTVPTLYTMGTAETGGIDYLYGYDNGPPSLQQMKAKLLAVDHLYGGLLSFDTLLAAGKIRSYTHRVLSGNLVICWADHLRGVTAATTKLRLGFEDRLLTGTGTVYESQNL